MSWVSPGDPIDPSLCLGLPYPYILLFAFLWKNALATNKGLISASRNFLSADSVLGQVLST